MHIRSPVILKRISLAIALFVGFGPIFIMCLMFDYTKQMFERWLMLGIGTMFALAVMSFTVTLALDAILAVTASFWAGKVLLGSNPEGVTSVAMQQGGLGLFMTASNAEMVSPSGMRGVASTKSQNQTDANS